MRREDRETIPEGYQTAFDKLSIRWGGLIFIDDQIVVPIELRRHIAFRSLQHNQNDLGSENILVAWHEQSQGLHRKSGIR